jgi:hypothetical protein
MRVQRPLAEGTAALPVDAPDAVLTEKRARLTRERHQGHVEEMLRYMILVRIFMLSRLRTDGFLAWRQNGRNSSRHHKLRLFYCISSEWHKAIMVFARSIRCIFYASQVQFRSYVVQPCFSQYAVSLMPWHNALQ